MAFFLPGNWMRELRHLIQCATPTANFCTRSTVDTALEIWRQLRTGVTLQAVVEKTFLPLRLDVFSRRTPHYTAERFSEGALGPVAQRLSDYKEHLSRVFHLLRRQQHSPAGKVFERPSTDNVAKASCKGGSRHACTLR